MAATNTSTDTATIARDLVQLCNAGRSDDVIDRYYSPDIVSIESMHTEAVPSELRGIDAIRAKNAWWTENNEVHSAKATGPFIGENQFAVKFDFDSTFRPTGQRTILTEMALYDVKDGRIVREQFFYNVPAQ